MKIKLQLSRSEMQVLWQICEVAEYLTQPRNGIETVMMNDISLKFCKKVKDKIYYFKHLQKFKLTLSIVEIWLLNWVTTNIQIYNYASYEQNFILMLKMEIDKFKTNLIR